MPPISERAHAKVNLALEVLGRRADGYHEVCAVLQTVGLWDEVTVEPAEELSLECSIRELETPENLVFRAAQRLRETTGVRKGARIVLHKGIPVAAGLGGGSSDAAATLRALSRLWGVDLPEERLVELAAALGSDVPFFLRGGTALAQGRGEQVTSLPPVPTTWLVLVCPPIQKEGKTAALYGLLRAEHFTDGSVALALAEAIRRGEPPGETLLFNTFERVAHEAYPALAQYQAALLAAGGLPRGTVHLAGSGPILFALAPSRQEGQGWASRLKARGIAAHLVATVVPGQGLPTG